MNFRRLVIFFSLIPLFGYSALKEDCNIKNGCLTYVSNLTTEDLIKQRDICYTVNLNQYNEHSQTFWFTVSIVDNEKKSTINLNNLTFKKRHESWQTIDYHVDDTYGTTTFYVQIKSLIYFKDEKKWCILLKENSDFKYISFFKGSQFIDEFGVGNSKRPNSQNSL